MKLQMGSILTGSNIPVRLIFHLYCEKKEDILFETESKTNNIHRKILTKYADKFSYAVFCIVVNDVNDTELICAAVKWILSCGFKNGFEIKIKQNDVYRDARTFFNEFVYKLNELDCPVLFAHNKGCTYSTENEEFKNNVAKWTIFAYFSILRNFDCNVHNLIQKGLCCGYTPICGVKLPVNYEELNKYHWHIPGNILLLNPVKISDYIRNKGIELPKLVDHLSGEMFIGNVYNIADDTNVINHSIIFENHYNDYFFTDVFNPYLCKHSELIRFFLDEDIAKQYDDFFYEIIND